MRFLLNTHWHGDHTGGNENFGKAGAVIVAHDNVRERMSVEQFQAAFNRRTPPSPKDALPVVTFTRALTLHLNGGPIRATHVENAHTDGDAFVFFEKQNTVHLGDTYFAGRFPFFDQSSGGSIDGMVAAADTALGLVSEDTVVIPGHGALSNVKELRAYRDMLAAVRDRVKAGIAAGKSLEQIQAEKPTKGFESFDGGFVNAETFVRLVHASLTAG